MSDKPDSYIDTPRGIFSASGVWFHTREEQLQRYAAGVLAHEPLEDLLEQAVLWMRSSQTVTVWGLLVMLLLISPAASAVGALLLYIGWELVGPRLVNRPTIWVLKLLERAPVQLAGYLLGLSYLAQVEAYWAVAAGLLGFILLRWQLLGWALRPLIRRLRRPLYELPIADHVLRWVIIRAALAYHVNLPQIDQLEQHVMRMMRRSDRNDR